jgi:hypothetical protein
LPQRLIFFDCAGEAFHQILAQAFGVPPSGGQRAKLPEGGTPNLGK